MIVRYFVSIALDPSGKIFLLPFLSAHLVLLHPKNAGKVSSIPTLTITLILLPFVGSSIMYASEFFNRENPVSIKSCIFTLPFQEEIS